MEKKVRIVVTSKGQDRALTNAKGHARSFWGDDKEVIQVNAFVKTHECTLKICSFYYI